MSEKKRDNHDVPIRYAGLQMCVPNDSSEPCTRSKAAVVKNTALRPVHTGTNIGARYSSAFFNAFFVFTPKRFSLTRSRVNMQIHSLTLDGA